MRGYTPVGITGVLVICLLSVTAATVRDLNSPECHGFSERGAVIEVFQSDVPTQRAAHVNQLPQPVVHPRDSDVIVTGDDVIVGDVTCLRLCGRSAYDVLVVGGQKRADLTVELARLSISNG